jgi:tetratricopeptide (TPR) repeat protein
MRGGQRFIVGVAAGLVALAIAAPLVAQDPAPASSAEAAPPSPEFTAKVEAAAKARQENRLDEAARLYLEAVNMQPDYIEGWWHLGTIAYELDRYEHCRDAFRRVAQRSPENAGAWGFIGLCEYQLGDYDASLMALLRARTLGIAAVKEVAPSVRYYAAIQLSRMAQYDQAIQILNEFAIEGNDNPRVIEAFGLAALRMPLLPSELPGTKRDLVMMAGRAQYFSAARMLPAAKHSFEQLATRYPETPSVHYAYGVFLLSEEPDAGIEELKKELQITPGDVWTMLQLSFEYIKRGDYETARTWAKQAVDGDPTNFVAHKALGQVLLELGETEQAIRELETGVEIAPDSPALRFQLAKAYQKAGRSEDAERERAEFTRLDRMVRASRTGASSIGGLDTGRANPPETQRP